MGGLTACSGKALTKRALRPAGRMPAAASEARVNEAVGETAEWQMPQAAQETPWACSQALLSWAAQPSPAELPWAC
ncbi:hypothetical protein D3C78_1417430 [compost metagenome]